MSHDSRTCAADSPVVKGGGANGDSCAADGGIMLFGVRVTVDSMRKSVSLNNLSQYELPHESGGGKDDQSNNIAADAVVVATGYASADDAVHHSSSGRERKRGVPWTEEEHKLFLLGLQKVGKGGWRGISKNFVKTRTPTQVASHAQKYFLRRNNLNRRRRRSSLFDITTDTVMTVAMEDEQVNQHENTVPTFLVPNPIAPIPVPTASPMENITRGQVDQANNSSTNLIRPIPDIPLAPVASAINLNLNLRPTIEDPSPLSLNLSLSINQNYASSHSAFQNMSSFSNGDSFISVA